MNKKVEVKHNQIYRYITFYSNGKFTRETITLHSAKIMKDVDDIDTDRLFSIIPKRDVRRSDFKDDFRYEVAHASRLQMFQEGIYVLEHYDEKAQGVAWPGIHHLCLSLHVGPEAATVILTALNTYDGDLTGWRKSDAPKLKSHTGENGA